MKMDQARQCSFHLFTDNAQKATIHQVATSKNFLFAGHNHLLITGAEDPTLIIARARADVGSSALVVNRWLGPGNRTFL